MESITAHPYFRANRISKHLVSFGSLSFIKKSKSLLRNNGIIKEVYPKMNLIKKRKQDHKMYPDLLKGVEITKINQVWSIDITYIRMAQGFVLVEIIHWFSRYILSCKLFISLENDFYIEALEEAIFLSSLREMVSLSFSFIFL